MSVHLVKRPRFLPPVIMCFVGISCILMTAELFQAVIIDDEVISRRWGFSGYCWRHSTEELEFSMPGGVDAKIADVNVDGLRLNITGLRLR